MNKRRRKHNKCGQECQKPVAQQIVPGPKAEPAVNPEELLFKPLSFESRSSCLSFEHIVVPFLIKDGKIFLVMFMDSCDLSVYLECYRLDNSSLNEYKDMSSAMKQCLEVQQETGIEYYFGKLNKAYDRYLYALRLFIEKGLLDKDRALELITDIGFDPGRMDMAAMSVENDLERAQARRQETKASRAAGDMMLEFLKLLAGDVGDNE